MTKLRAERNRRDEHGYTLVEMLVVVVILGIVAAPLSLALVQALNIVPSASARTKAATDNSGMLNQMSADIAQANPAGNASGTVWNGAANKWDLQAPSDTGTLSGTVGCLSSGNSSLVKPSWKDAKLSQDSTTPSAQNALWFMSFSTAAGASYTTVQVIRQDQTGTNSTYFTGYCKSGETVARVTTINAGFVDASGVTTANENVNVTLTLHPDSVNSPANSISIDSTVRV